MAQKAKGRKMFNIKKPFQGRQTIRGKLLFWLLIISLVPMTVIGLVSYQYSSSSLQRQSFEQLETTLAFQYQALHRYFDDQANKTGKYLHEYADVPGRGIYKTLCCPCVAEEANTSLF
ncbi:hypothetical protein GKODMF_00590 [Candidatus Electrothrix gigas]